jgi:transcriptional regulator with XRE-family HTH domain
MFIFSHIKTPENSGRTIFVASLQISFGNLEYRFSVVGFFLCDCHWASPLSAFYEKLAEFGKDWRRAAFGSVCYCGVLDSAMDFVHANFMTSSRLPNYLRMNRKRLGFSHDEVAFLLGAQNGTKICRYERRNRDPGFHTALAFEAIFQRPIRELFAGVYDEVAREIANRARILVLETDRTRPGKLTASKREVLTKISARKSKNHKNHDNVH